MKLKTIFILAGSFQEFKRFLHENPERDNVDVRYVYVDKAEKLMGHRGAGYQAYGTFYERKDAGKLLEFAERYLATLT